MGILTGVILGLVAYFIIGLIVLSMVILYESVVENEKFSEEVFRQHLGDYILVVVLWEVFFLCLIYEGFKFILPKILNKMATKISSFGSRFKDTK